MTAFKLFTPLSITLWLILGSWNVAGQTGILKGTVVLKLQDGTTSPISEAQVDVWRTDKSEWHHTKTDREGKFKLNLPFKGNYIVAVSAANVEPKFFLNIKTGHGAESVMNISLSPGDGKRLSHDDIGKAILRKETEPDEPSSGKSTDADFGPKVTHTYDRFTDKTTVEIDPVIIFKDRRDMMLNYSIGEFWLRAGYQFEGQRKTTPSFVVLGLSAIEATSHTEFLLVENRNIILLVDGERLNLGVMSQRLFSIRFVGNEERLEIAIPLSTLTRNWKRTKGGRTCRAR